MAKSDMVITCYYLLLLIIDKNYNNNRLWLRLALPASSMDILTVESLGWIYREASVLL